MNKQRSTVKTDSSFLLGGNFSECKNHAWPDKSVSEKVLGAMKTLASLSKLLLWQEAITIISIKFLSLLTCRLQPQIRNLRNHLFCSKFASNTYSALWIIVIDELNFIKMFIHSHPETLCSMLGSMCNKFQIMTKWIYLWNAKSFKARSRKKLKMFYALAESKRTSSNDWLNSLKGLKAF